MGKSNVDNKPSKEIDFKDLEVHVRDAIDQRVDQRLDRAKESVQLAMSWGIRGLALFGLLFAFFGIKSYEDLFRGTQDATDRAIHNLNTRYEDWKRFADTQLANTINNTSVTMIQEINRRLNTVDPLKVYNNRVVALYEDVLVNHHKMSLLAKNNNDFNMQYEADNFDRKTLFRILSDEKTGRELFENILSIVLEEQYRDDSSDMLPEIKSTLKQLKDEPHTSKKIEKLKILIAKLSESDTEGFIPEVREIIKTEGINDNYLKALAIHYLQRAGDDKLINIIESSFSTQVDPDIRIESIIALAHLSPSSTSFNDWFTTIITKAKTNQLSPNDLAEVTKVASCMIDFDSDKFYPEEESHKLKFPEKLESLLSVMLDGNVMIYSKMRGAINEDNRITINVKGNHKNLDGVPDRQWLDRISRVFIYKAKQLAFSGSFGELNRILNLICIRDNSFVRRRENRPMKFKDDFVSALTLTLNEDATIVLKNGIKLTSSDNCDTIILLPQENKPVPLLIWIDKSGRRRRAEPQLFSGENTIDFEMHDLSDRDKEFLLIQQND